MRRLLQPATAQSDRMFGFRIFDGYQRTLFDQAERVGGGHADSSVGGIGIGVPNPQRATGEVGCLDHLTTESVVRINRDTTERKNSGCGDQQVDASGDSLVDHRPWMGPP